VLQYKKRTIWEKNVIELYRPVHCPDCTKIEETLKELVVAHKIITLEPGQFAAELTPNTPLPAIKYEGQIIAGQVAIDAYLVDLEKIVADWRRFQSDACYIDDDGNVC
jgi:glutaredoxin